MIGRGYQSGRRASAGPFGKGTFFNFEKQAQSTESGLIITYAQGNGRIDLLTRQPDGTFQNTTIRALHGLVLTVSADGSKTIRRKDGSIERYSPTGRLVGLEDRNGNTITIERGVNDQITRIVDTSGLRALTFQYDTSGRVQQITDPINRTVQYAYNAAGYLESLTYPGGGIDHYTYDAAGDLLTIVDSRGNTAVNNEYDSQGRVVRQTLADGAVYTYSYGSFGTTITDTTVTDPRGNKTTTRFNAQLYAAGKTDRFGQQTRKTFNQNNQVTELRDPQNRVTKYTYDAVGNVTSVVDPQGNATLFEYQATFNRITKFTDALNHVTRFTYDAAGNLLTTINPLGHITTITYNQFGQPITVTDSLGNTTTMEYDVYGNLTVSTDPLGSRTLRTYDAVNRLIMITSPKGKTTSFIYDGRNHVVEVQNAITGLTRFTYDSKGNLLTATDAKGQTTTYTYDSMDRVITRKDALNRTESYQYDIAGNLTQFTNRKNQQTSFGYDSSNRRIRAQYPDAAVDWIYDTSGRLGQVSDSTSGTIEFAYDSLNRLVRQATAQGVLSYEYDVSGRRTGTTVNGQDPVSYQYDGDSRLVQVAQGSSSVGIGYDATGRRTSLAYSNGTNTAYDYDTGSRLTDITHSGPSGVIERLTYSHDVIGNIMAVTRTSNDATRLPTSLQAEYDASNQQIRINSTVPNAVYDENGNLVSNTDSSGTTNYSWNARRQLTSISGLSVNAVFKYDPLGRRILKTINGITTEFLYDGNDVIRENSGGSAIVSYLRSRKLDEPFIRKMQSESEFYHADPFGTVLALSDAGGAIKASYTYEPFGKAAVSGASSNSLRFTGREDDGTGLYYYRARYYSAALHRFLTEDPMRFGGGDGNFYAYLNSDPLNASDPLGLFPECQTFWAGSDSVTDISDQVQDTEVQFPLPRRTKPGWSPNPGDARNPRRVPSPTVIVEIWMAQLITQHHTKITTTKDIAHFVDFCEDTIDLPCGKKEKISFQSKYDQVSNENRQVEEWSDTSFNWLYLLYELSLPGLPLP
jgi:RHS repeat-associated protein